MDNQPDSQEPQPESGLARDNGQHSGTVVTTAGPSEDSLTHATGPRTAEGKERSKHNATTHGIFSSVIVLNGESSDEYESLLDGLWESLQPEGKLEEILVEKLATISWRHKRLLTAEGGEIQCNIAFPEWSRQRREQQEAETIEMLPELRHDSGLIWKIWSEELLGYCMELLAKLRASIAEHGFLEQDSAILQQIYGDPERSPYSLHELYLMWSEEWFEDQQSDREPPETLRQSMLDAINEERKRLKRYQKILASVEPERTRLEILRRRIPGSPGLERLLRYEASLERAFDRALNQLERLQRLRRGQPVAPRVDVNISS